MTREEWLAKRQHVYVLLQAMPTVRGCGNHSCMINKPAGLGTNAGCNCYKDIAYLALELAAAADEIKNIVNIHEDE